MGPVLQGSGGQTRIGLAAIKITQNGSFLIRQTIDPDEGIADNDNYVFKIERDENTGHFKLNVASELLDSMFNTSGYVVQPQNGGTGKKQNFFSEANIYSITTDNTANFPSIAPNGSLGIVYSNTASTASSTLTATKITSTVNANKTAAQSYYNLSSRYWNFSRGLRLAPAANGNYLDDWNDTLATQWARVGSGNDNTYNAALWVKFNLTVASAVHTTITGTFRVKGAPGGVDANYYLVNAGIGNNSVSGSSCVALYNAAEQLVSNTFVYTPSVNGHNSSNYVDIPFTLNCNPAIEIGTNQVYYLVFYSNNLKSIHFIDMNNITITNNTDTNTSRIGKLYLKTGNTWSALAQI